MVYKVLVVDDSHFFQMRLKEIINENPELKVVGIASNGQEAIEMADQLQPDIISMDYEMPYMDGVTAVKAIMAKRRVPIVMFSSMTYDGARITLDALEAGAVDFMSKNFAEVSRDSADLKKRLHQKLLTFARQAKPRVGGLSTHALSTAHVSLQPNTHTLPHATAARPAALANDTLGKPYSVSAPQADALRSKPPPESIKKPISPAAHTRNIKNKIKMLVIGASTGGPVALTEVLQTLPATFPVPVVVIQHMPEHFTRAFAERLDKICAVRVSEAVNGDVLSPGRVVVAPGGKQLIFDRQGIVKVLPGDDRVSYRPSLDVTFASAANVFGQAVLGVVLTGMGSDGCEGARLLKDKGAVIWGQDEATCVVYGMPRAVAIAGLTDEVLPLGQIGPRLTRDL